MKHTRLGVDVGGTFTDLILLNESVGSVQVAKVPTTPSNQADGVMAAIAATNVALQDAAIIVHGTTTTTNALLERKIARVGLITTYGFRDVLELGRRTRPNPYGMYGQFEPLIPRQLRLQVDERIDADGQVLTPLDMTEVEQAGRRLLELGCEAVVIHFLHAYANPSHELQAFEAIKKLWPNAYITLGHAILSEYREYERGTTASVNAAVQPILDRYIQRLRNTLNDAGYQQDLLVMQGNGGTLSSQVITDDAIKTVMSGPASGVIAAAFAARNSGIENVITYDMGGTSSDVALIKGGIPAVSSELELEYALPIHVPMVDVHTIGAGGGSIAAIDDAGMLQVGPQSAGADPGPICYGRGGTRPTITDANLVLGRLPAQQLLAVEQPVTVDHVADCIEQQVGHALGLDAYAAAAAILRIGNDKMASAIRMVSLTRGEDPRDFALFAFGGAGPLHATALAKELAIPKVLIPARPGITNAIGCVVADARYDFVQTLNQPLQQTEIKDITAILQQQIADGKAALEREQTPIHGITVLHSFDMQFRGQTHLLKVELDADTELASLTQDHLQALFAAAYFNRFAVKLPEIGTLLVNLNTTIIGKRPSIQPQQLFDASACAKTLVDAQIEMRPVWFASGQRASGQRANGQRAGDWYDTPIYLRERLPLGSQFVGPAIVQQLDTTTVIEPDNEVTVDQQGNLLITVASAWQE